MLHLDSAFVQNMDQVAEWLLQTTTSWKPHCTVDLCSAALSSDHLDMAGAHLGSDAHGREGLFWRLLCNAGSQSNSVETATSAKCLHTHHRPVTKNSAEEQDLHS